MMKKADAERAILAEIRKRLHTIPYQGADGGMLAYLALKNERPDLFDFSSTSEEWQLVQGWLKKAKIVAS